jgi:hypothetical protein
MGGGGMKKGPVALALSCRALRCLSVQDWLIICRGLSVRRGQQVRQVLRGRRAL